MVGELFWQRPMSWWNWEHLQQFLDENIREGPRLDYKEPSYNGQSHKWDLKPELTETIVAFANSGDGLLVIGVAEGADKCPGKLVGVHHSAPEDALRSHCAQAIEPTLPLEIQVTRIPEGESGAGKSVVVVRVRRGENPPYLLRGRGVYVRQGDQDRHATVPDLQALFDRRKVPASPERSPWAQVQEVAFSHLSAQDRALPTVIGVAVAPVFPRGTNALTEPTEHLFRKILRDSLDIHEDPFLEPDGFSYIAPYNAPPEEIVRHGKALSDGSIGLQRAVVDTLPSDNEGRWISIITLWRGLLILLREAQRWPREALGITGPLHYALGVGNLTDSYFVLDEETRSDAGLTSFDVRMPQRRTQHLYWMESGEWEESETSMDIVGREFESLARLLQCRYYPKLRPWLNALLDKT